MSGHPWSLVAPWYRWHRQPGVAPRETRPVLHKYETSQLVELFRGNPQRSLKFTPEDFVDGRRKLFLAQHKRFYLVVCELHCDRRGFPNAGHDDVCQAGFVVRRRRIRVPEELRKDATRLMQRIAKRRAQIAMLRSRQCEPPRGGPVAVAQLRQVVQREARAQERLGALQAELEQFSVTHELAPALEGWVPSELENVGAWERIEDDRPVEREEQVFSLYPLIPDRGARPHAARGRALYYGLVPTAVADTLADGAPRLNASTSYEIQCFVRRHDPRCPRRPGRRDCRGGLTWSAPTEAFTLASPQDLVGTSNRPVTVQLPDIPALTAQARRLPFGAGAPLRMAAPAGSALPVSVDGDGKAKRGIPRPEGQICSFAIPLITIVAYFVLRLFLPIVMLLFGLWFLLKLRFCIQPSIDLGLDLSAELAASKGGLELDAGLKTGIQAAFSAMSPDAVRPLMPGEGYDGRSFADMADDPDAGMTLEELLEVFQAQQSEPTTGGFGYPPPLPAGAVPSPNSALAPLIWEEELPIPELEEVA